MCLSLGSFFCLSAAARADDWWNADWPYRVRINCKEGEGDVAQVTVALASRTTPDGRDLRLVDADGTPRAFQILHHDPRLQTLLAFEAPPGKPVSTFLYYGNLQAPAIRTNNPRFEDQQKQYEAWRKNQAERNEALKRKQELERELSALRGGTTSQPALSPATQPAPERLAALEKELAALVIPPALPEPKAAAPWAIKRGILLKVFRKAKPGHPTLLKDLRHMAAEGQLEGAGFRAAISDGFNPFNISAEFVGEYDAWLRIDEPGEYAFCTCSDDGSWVVIDGKETVAWPGAHGFDGSQRGEKHGTAKLSAGVVHVEYYHEQGTGGTLAFLGWKPPKADAFGAIPNEQWLAVRGAGPGAYECRPKPLVAVPQAEVVSTYWIRDSNNQQVTMVRFVDRGRSRAGEVKERLWDFGDGLRGAGADVTHAYFRLGRPEVQLTIVDAKGNQDTAVCAPLLFKTDYVARSRKYGDARDYIAATKDYDCDRLARDDLALYAEFCYRLEQWPQHVRAARACLARLDASQDAPAQRDLAALCAPAAQSCLQPQCYDPHFADELLQRALGAATVPRARAELLLQRGRLAGWYLGQPDAARTLFDEALAVGAAETQPAAPDKAGKEKPQQPAGKAKEPPPRTAAPPKPAAPPSKTATPAGPAAASDRPKEAQDPKELEKLARERQTFIRKLRRDVLLGRADTALAAGDFAQAETLYQAAETAPAPANPAGAAAAAGAPASAPTAQADRLTKIGTYEFTVDDLLARGEYGYAREVLDKWEDEFPLQKLEGRTLFWRGKVLFVEHPGELALRYLKLAEQVAPRALHVPEAVWLRANCYLALDRREDALAELRRVATDFTYTDFAARARAKLKELETK